MPDTEVGMRDELLAAYDAQLRGDAEVAGAEIWDRAGPLWRAVFRYGGFVSYESLEELGDVAAVNALIAGHVAAAVGRARQTRIDRPLAA